MSSPRNKARRGQVKIHRELILCNAINNLALGKSTVNYAHTRWIKLKQIRGK